MEKRDEGTSSCAVPGQALPEMSRGSSFNLNLDVVRMILSFCYASDLLQISLASHQLRDEAMKEIISRPVSLIRNHRAELFGRFMLTSCENPPFSLLKTLILDDIDLEWERHMVAKRKQFDNSEVLLTMMERATNLRNLKIHRCDRYLADTRFMQAIRAMRHLDRLYINVGKQESHQHVADLMHGLTSSLKTMEYPAVIDGDDPIPQALFRSLSKLQPQLETLCIAIQSLTPPTQPSPFLHVRVLDLTVTLGNSTTLEQLVSVFPRLQELSIFMYDSQLADVNNPSTEMVAARNAAAALQESGRGWPRLDRLGGLIADLYVLACPVSRLQLLNYYEDAHPAFCDVISRTRPSWVDLDLFCSAWLEVGAALPTILVYGDERDPGAVTHLVVRLTITASPPTPSRNMVGTVAPFLQNSRVEYLHLAIGRMFSTDEIDEDFLTPRTVDAELKTTMDGIDVGYLVSSLVACGTCLRTVVLSLATRDQSVWTVDKVEGQRTWRRLDAYAGRMVVAREEAAVM